MHDSEVSSVFCEICKKEFKGKNQLKRHEKNVHMDLREFGCQLCKERFKRPWHLTRHHQLVHEKQANNTKSIKSEASSTESFSSPLMQSPETSSNNSQQNINNNNVVKDPSGSLFSNASCSPYENSIQTPPISTATTNNPPSIDASLSNLNANNNNVPNVDSFNKFCNNNSIETVDFIGNSDSFTLDNSQQNFTNNQYIKQESPFVVKQEHQEYMSPEPVQPPQSQSPYYPSNVSSWNMTNYDSSSSSSGVKPYQQSSENSYNTNSYNMNEYSNVNTYQANPPAMVSNFLLHIFICHFESKKCNFLSKPSFLSKTC